MNKAFTPITDKIVTERDCNGNPLVSIQLGMLDMGRYLRRDPRFPDMIMWTSLTDEELAQESIEMEKIGNEIKRKLLFGDI